MTHQNLTATKRCFCNGYKLKKNATFITANPIKISDYQVSSFLKTLSGCRIVRHNDYQNLLLLTAKKLKSIFILFLFPTIYFFPGLDDKNRTKNWIDSWLTRCWLVTRGWLGLGVGSCYATIQLVCLTASFLLGFLSNARVTGALSSI